MAVLLHHVDPQQTELEMGVNGEPVWAWGATSRSAAETDLLLGTQHGGDGE